MFVKSASTVVDDCTALMKVRMFFFPWNPSNTGTGGNHQFIGTNLQNSVKTAQPPYSLQKRQSLWDRLEITKSNEFVGNC